MSKYSPGSKISRKKKNQWLEVKISEIEMKNSMHIQIEHSWLLGR